MQEHLGECLREVVFKCKHVCCTLLLFYFWSVGGSFQGRILQMANLLSELRRELCWEAGQAIHGWACTQVGGYGYRWQDAWRRGGYWAVLWMRAFSHVHVCVCVFQALFCGDGMRNDSMSGMSSMSSMSGTGHLEHEHAALAALGDTCSTSGTHLQHERHWTAA